MLRSLQVLFNFYNNSKTGTTKCPYFTNQKSEVRQATEGTLSLGKVEPVFKFGTPRLKSVLIAITVHVSTVLAVHFYFIFAHYSVRVF